MGATLIGTGTRGLPVGVSDCDGGYHLYPPPVPWGAVVVSSGGGGGGGGGGGSSAGGSGSSPAGVDAGADGGTALVVAVSVTVVDPSVPSLEYLSTRRAAATTTATTAMPSAINNARDDPYHGRTAGLNVNALAAGGRCSLRLASSHETSSIPAGSAEATPGTLANGPVSASSSCQSSRR
jgi:hypothetical protein